MLKVTQPSYADWERSTVALRPEHLSQLATILKVSVAYLLGHVEAAQHGDKAPPQRGAGPEGKARRVFAEVSRLPRSQQQYIVRVVEDLLDRQRRPKVA